MSETRAYPLRPIVGVGAVVLRDQQVLLVKRRFEPLAGHWTLPGGVVELGETLEAALAREVLEETSLEARIGPVVEVFDRIVIDGARRVQYHYVIIDYLCEAVGGLVCAGSDVSEAVWVDTAQLGPYHLTERATAVVARAVRMKS